MEKFMIFLLILNQRDLEVGMNLFHNLNMIYQYPILKLWYQLVILSNLALLYNNYLIKTKILF